MSSRKKSSLLAHSTDEEEANASLVLPPPHRWAESLRTEEKIARVNSRIAFQNKRATSAGLPPSASSQKTPDATSKSLSRKARAPIRARRSALTTAEKIQVAAAKSRARDPSAKTSLKVLGREPNQSDRNVHPGGMMKLLESQAGGGSQALPGVQQPHAQGPASERPQGEQSPRPKKRRRDNTDKPHSSFLAAIVTPDRTPVALPSSAPGQGVLYRRTCKGQQLFSQKKTKILRDPAYSSLLNRKDVQTALNRARLSLTFDFWSAFDAHSSDPCGPDFDEHLKTKLEVLVDLGIIVVARPGRKNAAAASATQIAEHPPDSVAGRPSRLLSLPVAIRLRIWEYTVVHPRFFVDPNLPTGREQPDLAMTSRTVRLEVLPIFYAKNIFVVPLIELGSVGVAKPKAEQIVQRGHGKPAFTGLTAVQIWMRVLHSGGWLVHIRHWAFSHVSLQSRARDLVVSICLRRDADALRWRAGTGIHRKAGCLLGSTTACRAPPVPSWVEKEVQRMLDASSRSTPDGAAQGPELVALAKSLRDNLSRLEIAKCAEGS